MPRLFSGLFSALILMVVAAQPARASDDALAAAISGPQRSADFRARDAARHPQQELEFFGLRPDASVVEIWPGGGYWTEILAPYLHDRGTLYVAPPPAGRQKFEDKLKANPAIYEKAILTELGPATTELAPAGAVDFILTFRNLHNWMAGGYAEQSLAAFFKALKPGGVLGIEEHRGSADVPQDPLAKSGYVREDYAIALAKKAGFVLAGKSEINANPRDTKDYPKGVWTLPPSFALGDVDREKYRAIGEADNFVLKFVKP